MEEFMEKLWSCLPSAEDEAKTVLHRIIQHFDSGLSSEEKDVSLHLMFQEERGIGSFLRAVTRSDMKKITSEILLFFSFLLGWHSPSLEKYVSTIQNIAMSVVRNKSSLAEMVDKALDVLIDITKRPWSAALDSKSVINQLVSMASHRVSKPTVLRKVYCLVGTMAEEMPAEVNEKHKGLLSALLKDLEYQTSLAHKVEFSIIEGCFDGLSGFLCSFPLDESTDFETCKRVVSYASKVLKVLHIHRKTAGRAALHLIGRHGDQFHGNFVCEFEEWHKILLQWLKIGKEERGAAKEALLTYYYVLAKHVSSHQNTKEILKYFSTYFRKQFESSENVDIAVRGFGLFAKAMKVHSPEEIPVIFNILAQRSHEECGRGNHHKIADYLDSLSVLSAESGMIHDLQLSILVDLSVQLICQFAQEEHPVWQAVMVEAIICTLLRLSRCSVPAFETYMSTVVHQGVIRTVFNPVTEDAEMLREAGEKTLTYENYLTFWKSLVTLNKATKGVSFKDATMNEKRDVSKKLIDKILQSVLDIIDRLDLSLRETVSSEPIYQCNVEKCVEANSPQDFTVLVNVVNFTASFLTDLLDQSPLNKWMSPLIQLIVRLSSKHPLASSFYKLLAHIILIGQNLGYFNGQTDEMEDVEWSQTVNLLSGFLHDVILRQSQYHGDLQVSCLQLMLAIPSCIAIPLLNVCAAAFQSVFRLGCSMLSLAQEGLKTLIRWNKDIPGEKMKILLKSLLPSFDSLLRTKDNVADEEDDNNMNGMAMVRRALNDQKKEKLWKFKANTHVDTELVQLQKEIILFLSTLDSATYLCLLNGSEDLIGATSWQQEKLLMFPLPFLDMKVDVSLDDVLPRLADLAVSCSDRQTRSAACEFLHAVIMFMLGKEKQLVMAQQGHLTSLWKNLFPKILTLACDMDVVVSQLFCPLGEQLAHWYSSRFHEKSEQSGAFLTALLEGITHPTDAALRDYSARCIQEYVVWSRKQGHMQTKVEPVIKFISNLCHHPCPQKRLGAALAFNSIYVVLRENELIVDEFWIEILYCLVSALSLCSITGEDSQTEAQLEKSLQHICRVLIACSNRFNQDISCRRIPREMEGGRLCHVVRWLLHYCTTLNPTCRHSCMKMVDRLASYVSECCSTKDFIQKVASTEGLLEIAEGMGGLPTTIPTSTIRSQWDEALAWVHSLLASVESYMWLIEMKTSPNVLFTMKNSKIMQALIHFLEGVERSESEQVSLWRPKAMENFNSAKCFAIVRMIEFLTVCLNSGQGDRLHMFWNVNFWKILSLCCLRPSHLGFDSASKSIVENLPVTVENFLKSLTHYAPQAVTEDLKRYFKDHISLIAPELLEKFHDSVRNDKVSSKERDLLRGLKVLQTVYQDAQTWSGLVGETSLQLVFSSIVACIVNHQYTPVELSPLATVHAVSMLELFFATCFELKPLILLTANQSLLSRSGLQGELTHGEHFVACFEATLVPKLLKEPEKTVNVLEELLSPEISPQNLTILPSVLKLKFQVKSTPCSNQQSMVDCLFSKWEMFVAWAQGNYSKETWLISLLVQVVKLNLEFSLMKNCARVCAWIVGILIDPSKSLPLKTDLLHCLPIVCSNFALSDVKACLQDFKDQHFPTSSLEFKTGSEEYFNFKRAFEILLQSLVTTGNSAILQFVVKVMSADPNHSCHHLLPTTLENFMRLLHEKQEYQIESLFLIYSMFDNETICFEYRVRILNDFLLRLVQYASQKSQIEFAKKVIKKLLEVIRSRLSANIDGNRERQKLLSHIGAWKLLQQIYSIEAKSLFEGKGSDLVQAAFSGTDIVVDTGKELTTQLTKRALDAFKYSLNLEALTSEASEMYRVYMCAVYNVLATLLCNLKTDPSDAKFYEKLLFDEKSKKVWRLLVDEKKTYMLPFQLTEHLKKVEKAVSIRSKLSQQEQVGRKVNVQRSLPVLESQSFADSLENDITRFDFSHSKLRSTMRSLEFNDEKSVILLENDDLNEHECMATMCCIISRLVDSGISPIPSSATPSAMPGWMDAFKNSLQDKTSPRNSHIFILRVILNCEMYFSPYAIYWIEPILNCIRRHCLTNGISYLLGDVLCMLTKWSSENSSIKIHRSDASRILEYLVENCPHSLRSVFKYHLDLIKSILEVWKEYITLPYEKLTNILKLSDQKVGINITAIMLFYDFIPWTSDSKTTFISFLMGNLKDSKKEVFKASSETLGLCLKHLTQESKDNPQEFESYIHGLMDLLKDIHLKQRDCDRFLTILYGIHENYPQIVDSFAPAILLYLDQSIDGRRAVCLSLLAKRLDVLGENPYAELKGRGLLGMLSDRNSDVQIRTLQIFSDLAPSLSDIELHEVVHELSIVFHLIKGEARHLAFEVSLIAFDRYSIKQECNILSETGKKVFEESKALLLFGLVDSNVDLQKKCFAKWTEEERLPQSAADRLTTMLSLMYSPITEQHFLSYSVPLLLEGTANTPDFQSPVFTHALEECTFEDQAMNISWRRPTGMIPMFAQTLSSQRSQAASFSSNFDSSHPLLATQNSLIYQPTADVVDGSSSSKTQFKMSSSVSRSSFLFSQNSNSQSSKLSKANYKQSQEFGIQRLRFIETNDPEIRETGSSLKLNRHLGKNAVKVYSTANVRRAKMRQEMWKDRARKREGQVSLSRKYRKGDFPDIQIKVADFVNPLMDLTRRDTAVAKKIMVNIFMGVKTVLDTSENVSNFKEHIETLLNEVLKMSKNYDPSTIGTCLEIAYHGQMDLEPELVFKAAVNGTLPALGVLLLEKTAEKKTVSDNNSEEIWVHLSRLYDELGERDIAHATLLHHVPLGVKSKAALEAHAEEQWLKAKKLYYEALNETQHENFYESCFECMVELSEWEQINKVIRAEVDALGDLWHNEWYERKLLPWLLQSEVFGIIQKQKDEHQFLSVISQWLSDEGKETALKEGFSEILSILSLVKKKFPESRYYGNKTLSKFVNEWIELNPLFRRRRETVLINVQNICDVVNFFPDGKAIQSADDCDAFLKKLERLLPNSEDSLVQWETRTCYRIACLSHLQGDMQSQVKKTALNMQLSLVEAALQQRNHNFAKKYLTTIKGEIDSCGPLIKARFLLAQCLEKHQFTMWKADNNLKQLDNLLLIWVKLDSVLSSDDLNSDLKLSIATHSAESDLSFSIRQLMSQDLNLVTKIKEHSDENYRWLCEKLQLQSTSASNEFVASLESIGLSSIVCAKNIAKSCHVESAASGEQLAKAYLKMAQYCLQILDCRKDSGVIENTYSKCLVGAILSAMKYGSNRARQLFPLLLQLPAISSGLSDDFKSKSATVPEWMFIGWIPQMLGLLDTAAINVVGPLLLKIAKKYPNAVSCPYNISRETNLGNNGLKQILMQKLDSVLEGSSSHLRLVQALSCLTQPSFILKDFVNKLDPLIGRSSIDWNSVEKVCDTFKYILAGADDPSAQTALTGKLFQSIHNEKVLELFQDVCGAINSKSREEALKSFIRIKGTLKKVEVDEKNIKGYSKLKDFSPWLANFSSAKMNISIEIPGQYTGDQKPAPERHIMISRFGDTVQIMTSIRKPVKLTIIGSDANNHNFLVKYGEDLRQDERIQQLLDLMNGVFSHNHHCRKHQLSVVTYKVVPLSNRLGIIEWVDNTSSLKELMLLSLSNNEEQKIQCIREEHSKWLKQDGDASVSVLYGNAHKKYNRKESADQFSTLESMAKPDMVRRGLEMWSSSAEAFYWLRQSFISSYSTLCIAHWLLGVGDRHLSNCLVSNMNGKCIGIDFGHAFGSATQFLPVPELVPFRLTPHIVNVVKPHGTRGVIEETMVNALRALQTDSEVLLATMQVFIQEPSLDWLTYAKKHFSENEGNSSWLPALKIQQATRKLKGVNPVTIMKEDLGSKMHEKFREGFCRTLMGDRRHNIRAQLEGDELTTRQQVECLIDLATDPNVLIKTYAGWEPWM